MKHGLTFGKELSGLCGRGRPDGKPGSVPDAASTGWWLGRCAGCTEHREQNVEGEQLRKGGWKGKINSPVQWSPNSCNLL